MPATVTVLTGPARCGKTALLLARYRETLAECRPGATLWLAPTWRAVADVRGRLLDRSIAGCLAPGVMTFEQFAEAVLEFAAQPIRPVSRLMKRHLVRGLLEQHHRAGRLKYFGPIAQTSGLVDLVGQWIGELKRLEIWPNHFRDACSARGMTPKDEELLELYEAYQERLNRHQLYDAEGRFWTARTLLEEGQRRPFEQIELVVADGFTDFTRTQHEILGILAGRVGQLLIALPLEAGSGRADLFAKPAKTLELLRRWHPGLEVQEVPRPKTPDWAAMGHLEQALFGNPRRVRPAVCTAGIEIIAASRELGEIEQIGARIKTLLTKGCEQSGGRPVRPGDVAVVFRNPAAADALVREAFGRLGIPYWLESGRALDRSTALRALVGLLQLDVEDWPFRDLLAVLAGNYFQPDWHQWHDGRAAAAAEHLIRRLQIPRGRDRLIERVKRIAQPPAEDDDEPSQSARRRADQARLAWPLLERLGQALDQLPRRATLGGWATAWRRLADETGLLSVIPQESPSQGGLSDATAWARLQDALAVAARLSQWMSQGGVSDDSSPPPAPNPQLPALAFVDPLLDRREAIAALLDTMASVQIADSGDETASVRVLSATSVRALRVPYLFLAGLSERAFPPPDREDRLYGEGEAQRLIDEGLPLVARGERNREEMLLFYEALTRATRRLWLSYPALDERAGPLSPSPYLNEVEQACGAGRVRRAPAVELSPVPVTEEPLSAVDFRVKAVAMALAGNVGLLAGLVGSEASEGMAANLLDGLRLLARRQGRDEFGPAEGMLGTPAARASLATRFDPARTFSATELERYAACPFRFYLESILRLEPLEDLALAIDYLERGRLAHDVLATLHAEINRVCGRPASPGELSGDAYQRLLEETLRKALDRPAAHPIAAALGEVDRRLLIDWLADYLRQHAAYDGLWSDCDRPLVPTHFEVSFGKGVRNLLCKAPFGPFRQKVPDTFSTATFSTAFSTAIDPPLEIEAAGRTVRLSGRIDRVDTGQVAGRVVFNVLDYKTGGSTRFSLDAVAAGTALQLPLYALAVEKLLLADQNAVGWMAGYWYLKQAGFKKRSALRMHRIEEGEIVEEPEWEEIRRVAAETVVALAEGIRRAEFPVANADPHCTRHCPFKTVCRIHQVRSLEKTWKPALPEA